VPLIKFSGCTLSDGALRALLHGACKVTRTGGNRGFKKLDVKVLQAGGVCVADLRHVLSTFYATRAPALRAELKQICGSKNVPSALAAAVPTTALKHKVATAAQRRRAQTAAKAAQAETAKAVDAAAMDCDCDTDSECEEDADAAGHDTEDEQEAEPALLASASAAAATQQSLLQCAQAHCATLQAELPADMAAVLGSISGRMQLQLAWDELLPAGAGLAQQELDAVAARYRRDPVAAAAALAFLRKFSGALQCVSHHLCFQLLLDNKPLVACSGVVTDGAATLAYLDSSEAALKGAPRELRAAILHAAIATISDAMAPAPGAHPLPFSIVACSPEVVEGERSPEGARQSVFESYLIAQPPGGASARPVLATKPKAVAAELAAARKKHSEYLLEEFYPTVLDLLVKHGRLAPGAGPVAPGDAACMPLFADCYFAKTARELAHDPARVPAGCTSIEALAAEELRDAGCGLFLGQLLPRMPLARAHRPSCEGPLPQVSPCVALLAAQVQVALSAKLPQLSGVKAPKLREEYVAACLRESWLLFQRGALLA
jgi:hypothetical protein